MEMGLAVRDRWGEGRAAAVLITWSPGNSVLCVPHARKERKEKYSLHRKFESLILKANCRVIKYFEANKGEDLTGILKPFICTIFTLLSLCD